MTIVFYPIPLMLVQVAVYAHIWTGLARVGRGLKCGVTLVANTHQEEKNLLSAGS
jgi:hypothetical protein